MADQQYKADAGKLQARLLFEGVPRSLLVVIAVLTYGAQKYEAHSWVNVEADRYKDAGWRHLLAPLAGLGELDSESGLIHEAHAITNQLFLLEKKLKGLSQTEFETFLKFLPPPQGHKGEVSPPSPSLDQLTEEEISEALGFWQKPEDNLHDYPDDGGTNR